MGALDGIRVLDVSQVLAGPYSAQIMADNGAEVIRVESLEGDLCRNFTPSRGGQSTIFLAANRGKRGIALNLKAPEARAVLHRLAERADIMIQSFLPARAKAFGIDYESVRRINLDLIHVTISGYGHKGPLRNKPGLDTMVSAYAGLMAMTGEADGPPARFGTPAIDMSTGMMAYGAAMTALIARNNGQGGQAVNLSLMETAISLHAFHATNWLIEGQVGQREGSGFLKLAPYEAMQCRDDTILLGAPSESGWQRICAALDAPDLAEDPRFLTNADRVTNRPALRDALEKILKTEDAAHWLLKCEAANAVAAPIHTVDQVYEQEQVRANDMIVTVEDQEDGELRLAGMPFKLSGTPGDPAGAPPRLGEHTEEVLRGELGMSDADIAALREAGAIMIE